MCVTSIVTPLGFRPSLVGGERCPLWIAREYTKFRFVREQFWGQIAEKHRDVLA